VTWTTPARPKRGLRAPAWAGAHRDRGAAEGGLQAPVQQAGVAGTVPLPCPPGALSRAQRPLAAGGAVPPSTSHDPIPNGTGSVWLNGGRAAGRHQVSGSLGSTGIQPVPTSGHGRSRYSPRHATLSRAQRPRPLRGVGLAQLFDRLHCLVGDRNGFRPVVFQPVHFALSRAR
jgi:hypothetical protein